MAGFVRLCAVLIHADHLRDVRRHPARLATFTPAMETANRALKDFLHGYVYNSIPLAAERFSIG